MRSRHGHGRSIDRSTDKFRLRKKEEEEEEEARSPSLPSSLHQGNQVKWRRRPIIPDLANGPAPFPPRPSFVHFVPYLMLSSAHVFSRSPPRNYKPDDGGGTTVVVHRVQYRLICVGSTERKRALLGPLSISISLHPFPFLLFCSLFPGASSVRLSDRGRGRWGELAS